MLRLSFFGRKTNSESELGAHIRVNMSNGNFKLSPSVVNKCNFSIKSRINFSYQEDGVYMALERRGLTLGAGNTFSSITHASDMKVAYAGDIVEGHDVIILAVDIENPIEAESEETELQAFKLSFMESQKAKAAVAKKAAKASK